MCVCCWSALEHFNSLLYLTNSVGCCGVLTIPKLHANIEASKCVGKSEATPFFYTDYGF